MAAPATKEQWREYCAYNPTPDSQRPNLSLSEIQALSDVERVAYNEARFAYINEERILPTRDLKSIENTARRFLLASQSPTFVVRRGMRVSGAARTGKSTAVMWAGKRLEAKLRTDNRRTDDPSYLPVVYVSITAATTPNKLWAVLAEFVGVPQLRGRNSDTRMFDLTRLLRDLGTRFVIIDDVQRLNTDRAAGAEVADALKTFAEYLDATMLYAGISLSTAPLFTGDTGSQWRARTIPVEMHTYSLATDAGRHEWRQLVASFEHYLPLARHQFGPLVDSADYLYHRTGGSIASLRDLIVDAATDAIDTGEETITERLLDTVAVADEPRSYDSDPG
jgi:hypothetical protein